MELSKSFGGGGGGASSPPLCSPPPPGTPKTCALRRRLPPPPPASTSLLLIWMGSNRIWKILSKEILELALIILSSVLACCGIRQFLSKICWLKRKYSFFFKKLLNGVWCLKNVTKSKIRHTHSKNNSFRKLYQSEQDFVTVSYYINYEWYPIILGNCFWKWLEKILTTDQGCGGENFTVRLHLCLRRRDFKSEAPPSGPD